MIPTLDQPIVYDNHYGIYFNQTGPSFHADHSNNSSIACKLLDDDPTPPIAGMHHVVWHSHSCTILATDLLHDIYQKVCWDIAYLKKILHGIPQHNKYAIAILSKEISHDKCLKKYLENRMWFTWQTAYHPPAAPLFPRHLPIFNRPKLSKLGPLTSPSKPSSTK